MPGRRPGRAVEQKIGDYFAACMDEKDIEAKGTRAAEAILRTYQGVRGQVALTAKSSSCTCRACMRFFDSVPTQDMKNADRSHRQVDQGGIGLPERDYYFKDDSEIGRDYGSNMSRTCRKCSSCSAIKPDLSRHKAKTVMAIETALAKGIWTSLSRAIPRRSTTDASEAAGRHRIRRCLGSIPRDRRSGTDLNVAVPEFFKTTRDGRSSRSASDDWKTYLKWHVVHSAAPLLPTAS